MNKIRTKLILIIVLCSFITTSFIGGMSIFKSSQIIDKKSESELSAITLNEANKFDNLFENIQISVNFLSNTVTSDFSTDQLKKNPQYLKQYSDKIAPVFKKMAESTDGVMSSYIYFNPKLSNKLEYTWFVDTTGTGNFQRQFSESISDFYPDNPDLTWYYEPIKEKKGLWTDVYTDTTSNNTDMISYTEPIYVGDTLVGVAGMDINFNIFKKAINNVKAFNTGYAYLLSKNGDFLVHPTLTNKDNIATVYNGSFKPLLNAYNKNNSGVIKYNYQGEAKLQGYSKISNGFIIAITVPQKEFSRDLNSLKTFLLIFMAIVLIISIGIGYFFSNTISSRVVLVTNALKKTAEFDLNYDEAFMKALMAKKSKDEVGQLTESLIKMVNGLKSIITEVREASTRVAASSEETNAAAEEIASSSTNQSAASQQTLSSMEQLDASIQNISRGIQEVTENISHVTNLTEDMRNSSQDIINTFENLSHQTQNTVKAADSGKEAVEKSQEGSNIINLTVSNLIGAIKDLGKSAESIGEIVDVIDDIAEQTNMLALNAAIEAARAGEHGKGFAVVAGAIRDLAEKSGDATKEISKLVGGIQEEVNTAVETAKAGAVEVEHGTELSRETEKAFLTIREAIEHTAVEFEKVMLSIVKQGKNINEIAVNIENINELTQTMAATVQEQTASSSEVVKAVENVSQSSSQTAEEIGNIASSSESLAKEAQNLAGLVSKFTINTIEA